MSNQKSVGVVVYRIEGRQIKYLMLHHEGQYWNFPKGRQEADEDDLSTALRELKEETGITEISIDPEFRYAYDYDFDTMIADGVKEKIHKHAIFFLGAVQTETVAISNEHVDFGWFDFQTALLRAFFQEGRDLLKAANEFLLKKQDFVL